MFFALSESSSSQIGSLLQKWSPSSLQYSSDFQVIALDSLKVVLFLLLKGSFLKRQWDLRLVVIFQLMYRARSNLCQTQESFQLKFRYIHTLLDQNLMIIVFSFGMYSTPVMLLMSWLFLLSSNSITSYDSLRIRDASEYSILQWFSGEIAVEEIAMFTISLKEKQAISSFLFLETQAFRIVNCCINYLISSAQLMLLFSSLAFQLLISLIYLLSDQMRELSSFLLLLVSERRDWTIGLCLRMKEGLLEVVLYSERGGSGSLKVSVDSKICSMSLTWQFWDLIIFLIFSELAFNASIRFQCA